MVGWHHRLEGHACMHAWLPQSSLTLRPHGLYSLPVSSVRGFSRQEYWNGLLFPPPGDLLDPGIKPASPVSPALQADSLPIEPPGQP